MIDAHCHLDMSCFDADRDDVIARARSVGVKGFICAGVEPAAWDKQADLSAQYPELKVAYGLHPHVASRYTPEQVIDAVALLSERAQFAIGETGLDRSKYCAKETLPIQRDAFRAQLALARERNFPVILHIVGAHGGAIDILRSDGIPQAGGMVHSYSGSAELVREYEALGLHISFSGSITRPNAKRVLAAAAAVSLDRLLVETDCPDQKPSSREGTRNLPEWLHDVVVAVANARGESADLIAETTARNAAALFAVEAWT